MAKLTNYFSHDVSALSDPKIMIMISLHGMVSYAWWWILIERLAVEEDCKLPYNKFTFAGLAVTFQISDNLEFWKQNEANASSNEANEAPLKQTYLARFFIDSLIEDCNLLQTDGEYFWSPSLLKRRQLREEKYRKISEKRREAGRLGGLASGESRGRKKATVKQNEANASSNEANEAKGKERKGNIYSYSYYSDAENKKSDELLHMFDDEPPKTDPYKNVFKIYMNDVGEISPMTKEKLEYLVNDFGESEVITAISKSVEVGKASIAYITAILNNKIREEAAKESGTNRRGKGTGKAKAKSDGSDVDWKNETGEWL